MYIMYRPRLWLSLSIVFVTLIFVQLWFYTYNRMQERQAGKSWIIYGFDSCRSSCVLEVIFRTFYHNFSWFT